MFELASIFSSTVEFSLCSDDISERWDLLGRLKLVNGGMCLHFNSKNKKIALQRVKFSVFSTYLYSSCSSCVNKFSWEFCVCFFFFMFFVLSLEMNYHSGWNFYLLFHFHSKWTHLLFFCSLRSACSTRAPASSWSSSWQGPLMKRRREIQQNTARKQTTSERWEWFA